MRRAQLFNVGFFIVGLAGLGFLVHHTGTEAIWNGLERVGLFFPVVVGIHLLVIASDSLSLWAASGGRLRWIACFRASLAGHGINEATPLAKLGEITKFTMLVQSQTGRDDEDSAPPGDIAASALIVQNITMFVAGCVAISIGAVVALVFFSLSEALTMGLVVLAVGFAIVASLGLVVFRFGIGGWPFRLLTAVGVSAQRVSRWKARFARVESQWQAVTTSRRMMTINWSAAALSRCLLVAEAAVILFALGSEHVFLAAVLSAASFQAVLWATSFIPMQVGSHEAGAYLLFASVGLSPQVGVVLELVRKLRRVTFVVIGLLVLGHSTARGLWRTDGSD